MRALVTFLSVLVALLLGNIASAQYYLDFGVKGGVANYLGDIGGVGDPRPGPLDMKLAKTRWNPGVFVRKKIKPKFSASLHLDYLRVAGEDNLSEDPNRYSRNLSFRNDILELTGRAEWIFFQNNDVGRRGKYSTDFKSYLFGGAGIFWNNPKTETSEGWVALQPFQTEGIKYSRIQPTIPYGFGFYFTQMRQHRIGFEISWRLTFTDYIDDASSLYIDPSDLPSDLAREAANPNVKLNGDPIYIGDKSFVKGAIRGNPDNNDSYGTAVVYYSYVLRGSKRSFKQSRYNYLYGKRKVKRSRAKF